MNMHRCKDYKVCSQGPQRSTWHSPSHANKHRHEGETCIHLVSVVKVIFAESSRKPRNTTVRLLGFPSGRTVASWKNVEYFRCLFASSALLRVDFQAIAMLACTAQECLQALLKLKGPFLSSTCRCMAWH